MQLEIRSFVHVQLVCEAELMVRCMWGKKKKKIGFKKKKKEWEKGFVSSVVSLVSNTLQGSMLNNF